MVGTYHRRLIVQEDILVCGPTDRQLRCSVLRWVLSCSVLHFVVRETEQTTEIFCSRTQTLHCAAKTINCAAKAGDGSAVVVWVLIYAIISVA